MTGSPAISVQGLSKEYRLGQALSRTLGEAVASVVRGSRPAAETIRALDDVTFDVAEGSVVGVIGRNGAGKSTLLRILSRITEPTSGRVSQCGRLASLPQVGTRFHPGLCG